MVFENYAKTTGRTGLMVTVIVVVVMAPPNPRALTRPPEGDCEVMARGCGLFMAFKRQQPGSDCQVLRCKNADNSNVVKPAAKSCKCHQAQTSRI